jgi:hypothetical protein
MRHIGFSTGALARNDVHQALAMLADKPVDAIELSALRQQELEPLVNELERLNLDRFQYKAFHAPSYLDESFERIAVELLQVVCAHDWPLIVHPDAMHDPAAWEGFGRLLCIENMDKRKPIGQTAADLSQIFEAHPNATFCLDLGHIRQVDPTMSEAALILDQFRDRLRQLHVSEVNAQSKHDALTLEAIIAFQKVSHLIRSDVPVILESRVNAWEIEEELANAMRALDPRSMLAIAGD